MATNEIFRTGLNELLRRTLTIKGDLPPSPYLAAEIVPVLALESERVEWGFLKAERVGVGEVNYDPPAGSRALAVLEVPTGTNLQVVVEKITVQTTVGATGGCDLRIAGPTTSLGLLIPNAISQVLTIARDTRNGLMLWTGFGQMGARVWLGDTNVPAIGGFVCDQDIGLNLTPDIIHRTGEWVLSPGWKLQVSGFLDVPLCVCFSWRERVFEPSEGPPQAFP